MSVKRSNSIFSKFNFRQTKSTTYCPKVLRLPQSTMLLKLSSLQNNFVKSCGLLSTLDWVSGPLKSVSCQSKSKSSCLFIFSKFNFNYRQSKSTSSCPKVLRLPPSTMLLKLSSLQNNFIKSCGLLPTLHQVSGPLKPVLPSK